MTKIFLYLAAFISFGISSYLLGVFFGYPLIATLIAMAINISVAILLFANKIVNKASDIE
jgi:uncharacterized membrane protein